MSITLRPKTALRPRGLMHSSSLNVKNVVLVSDGMPCVSKHYEFIYIQTPPPTGPGLVCSWSYHSCPILLFSALLLLLTSSKHQVVHQDLRWTALLPSRAHTHLHTHICRCRHMCTSKVEAAGLGLEAITGTSSSV